MSSKSRIKQEFLPPDDKIDLHEATHKDKIMEMEADVLYFLLYRRLRELYGRVKHTFLPAEHKDFWIKAIKKLSFLDLMEDPDRRMRKGNTRAKHVHNDMLLYKLYGEGRKIADDLIRFGLWEKMNVIPFEHMKTSVDLKSYWEKNAEFEKRTYVKIDNLSRKQKRKKTSSDFVKIQNEIVNNSKFETGKSKCIKSLKKNPIKKSKKKNNSTRASFYPGSIKIEFIFDVVDDCMGKVNFENFGVSLQTILRHLINMRKLSCFVNNDDIKNGLSNRVKALLRQLELTGVFYRIYNSHIVDYGYIFTKVGKLISDFNKMGKIAFLAGGLVPEFSIGIDNIMDELEKRKKMKLEEIIDIGYINCKEEIQTRMDFYVDLLDNKKYVKNFDMVKFCYCFAKIFEKRLKKKVEKTMNCQVHVKKVKDKFKYVKRPLGQNLEAMLKDRKSINLEDLLKIEGV